MELTKQQEEAQEIMNAVISKCWEDESFKQELIANPEETIFGFTGRRLNIPKGKKFIINDQTNDDSIHFNIPKKPDLENLELSEEQLELVAGGLTPTFIILAGIGTAWLLHEIKD